MKYLLSFTFCIFTIFSASPGEEPPAIRLGMKHLKSAIKEVGYSEKELRISIQTQSSSIAVKGGFRITVEGSKPVQVNILGDDDAGAMYGAFEIAEELMNGTPPERIQNRRCVPRFPFRAIKFNLPWMSYRKGPALQCHMETCRDLKFWERFLNMMAENRFNALTLWNLHPFTFMIRPKNYPEACGFSDEELKRWQAFWRKLFQMAADRGIETYIVNWNIFVSPEFAKKHNIAKYSEEWSYFGEGADSPLIRKYTTECITQVINEYPGLTGIGVSLGERMGGMTPQQREKWILDVVVPGLLKAKRKAKFIHRAPFSAGKGSGGSMDRSVETLTRNALEKLDLPRPIWVEVKFNWSHGHSSPKLNIIHGGKTTDAYWNPVPKNYRLTWMIRNEDFFCLRWGNAPFIREHIKQNGHEYVGGYFVGSECYIPAKDYFTKPGGPKNWDYAFERQWLFYKLWGRLLYDPKTPDTVFAGEYHRRYSYDGIVLYEAMTLASKMPLAFASFHKGTWDFTLYSEGFLAGPKNPFVTVQDLARCKPLDPKYISVRDFVKKKSFPNDAITPLKLADTLEKDATRALKIVHSVTHKKENLQELTDIQAWSYLSLYFADKLRGAVALASGEKKQAVEYLRKCVKHWDNLIKVTRPVYADMPLMHTKGKPFHWEHYRKEVLQDVKIAEGD